MRASRGGVVVTVHVQPGARQDAIVGTHGDAVKVKVTAPPVDGRANASVEALLATMFGRRPAQASVIVGVGSRRKQVLVRDLDLREAAIALVSHGAPGRSE